MSHVFISYSSRHRALTEALAARLAADGYSVWWDHALESWGEFEPQISAALEEAGAVVVVWSEGAIKSRFVKAEMERAERRKKLVSLRPADVPLDAIPMPYGTIDHVLPLDFDHFGPIERTIQTVWQGRVPEGLKPLHLSHRDTYEVDLFDAKRRPRPDDMAQLTPSALLQARYEIVPYVDATGVLADMLAWCRGAGEYKNCPISVAGRLLHGPGGLGKTRLMIEAAKFLREEGWLAGFNPPLEPGADEGERQHRKLALEQLFLTDTGEAGVLIVLDYAEARSADVIALARLARRRPDEGVRPLRIALLARGEAWWHDVYRAEPEVQVVFNRRGAKHGDLHAITPLPEGEARLDLFDGTQKAFRPLLEELADAGVFPPISSGAQSGAHRDRLATAPSYARPLTLQMEALLSLAGEGADDIAELLKGILALERAHWRRVIKNLSTEREDELSRGLAQVTLVGGVEARGHAEALLTADESYFGARPRASLPVRELRRLYGVGRHSIAALEPDLIGEHEVACLDAGEELVDACLAWIATLPEADRSPRRRALLTVLQRATRAEHGEAAEDAEAMLAQALTASGAEAMSDIVAVAVETPGKLAPMLEAAIGSLPAEILRALDAALPAKSIVLAELADAVVARRQIEAPRSAADDGHAAERAWLLHRRGSTLASLGRLDEALEATKEAVAIRTTLSKARPDAFERDLASSVSNLGIFLSRFGRCEEALAAIKEAIAIDRRLAVAHPDAFEADLATSLNHMSIFLSDLGRREEALAAADEAVAIHRRLAAVRPDAFGPDLAGSLNSLGAHLSDLGRWEDGLAATEEAVAMRRRLAESNPDAFAPNLATSLTNLGIDLSNLGRREESLAATEEAVAIHRRLAETRPDTFEPGLAGSLNRLGECLSDLGRWEEALAANEEAIAICRRLFEEQPAAFEPALAGSLGSLGLRLSDLKRCEEALMATEEAVAIYRRLAEARPEAFEPYLAGSLGSLGIRRSRLGRRAEALAATDEALAIRKRLAELWPETFEPDVARSLHQLGVDLAKLGRWNESLAATEEAIAIRRRFAEARPHAFEPDLANSLGNLGEVLVGLGQLHAAHEASREGIRILAPHHTRHPEAHREFMDALNEVMRRSGGDDDG